MSTDKTALIAELRRRTTKGLSDVNAAKREAAQAEYAIKAMNETIDELEACCNEEEHEHPPEAPAPTPSPAPEPTPDPTPTPTPEPTHPETSTTPVHLRPFAPLIFTQAELELYTDPTVHYTKFPGLEGALRFFGNSTCEPNYDDCLLYPGQKAKAHLHDYIGVTAYFDSTIESLARVGETRWVGNRTMTPVLWFPAGLSDGRVKFPDVGWLYYKQDSDTLVVPGFPLDWSWDEINRIAGVGTYDEKKARVFAFLKDYHAKNGTLHAPENIPQGMCMIGGHKMDGTLGNAEVRLSSRGQDFKAETLFRAVEKMRKAINDPLAETLEGDSFTDVVAFPNHFNGELGSDDYRSHLSEGEWGGRNFYIHHIAPASHPRTQLSVTAFRKFSQRAGEPPISQMSYSSDRPGGEPGDTLHADYMSIWPKQIRDTWHENIILSGVSTSTSGNTINYGGLKAINPGHSLGGWIDQPRYAPIPPRPVVPAHGEPGHHH